MKINKKIKSINDKIRKYQNIEDVVMGHVFPILAMLIIVFLISIGLSDIFDVEEILGDVLSALAQIDLLLIGISLIIATRMICVVNKLMDERDRLYEKKKTKK